MDNEGAPELSAGSDYTCGLGHLSPDPSLNRPAPTHGRPVTPHFACRAARPPWPSRPGAARIGDQLAVADRLTRCEGPYAIERIHRARPASALFRRRGVTGLEPATAWTENRGHAVRSTHSIPLRKRAASEIPRMANLHVLILMRRLRTSARSLTTTRTTPMPRSLEPP
jgi:hypothetical protein